MKKIRIGDTVQVISSKWKGIVGVVKKLMSNDTVIVEGVNVQKRAKKGEGYITKEGSIHISNVSAYDTSSSIASKVGIRMNKKGKKERFYKKTGNIVGA